jgi:nicotinamidase-related amidase
MQIIKEKYFTSDNITNVANELLDYKPELSYCNELDFDIDSSALIVLDMQEFFLSDESHAHVPSSAAIIPGIKRLIEKFDHSGRPIIFTRHLNNDQNSGMMSEWWRDILRRENPLSEISREFDVESHMIIEKPQYDAFFKTELNEILMENEIKTVVVCGVMTHLCCETTARSAFVHGFEVIFPVDGSASYNLDFHRSSLMNLSHGFSHLCTIEELL